MVRVKFPSKNGTGLHPGIRHKYMYIHFSPIPYGISGNSVQGFKRSCAYKKNDRPETYMYHVQKVCGKITLTLNFKKPANENMGFR